MLIRIVRMTFRPEEVDNFLALFDANKERIRHFPGCSHLELLQDIDHPNVLSTYSIWDNEDSLNAYRHSKVFEEVWHQTKIKFSDKPVAHSLQKLVNVDN